MCAILDSDVTNQVGTPSRLGAAQGFYDWLRSRRGGLVYSDKFLKEQIFIKSINNDAKNMIRQFEQSGIAIRVDPAEMEKERKYLLSVADDITAKEDIEILALARASGARLLFTNDRKLQKDFKNSLLINSPNGRIYTTNDARTDYSDRYRTLLGRSDLCRPRSL